MLVNSAIVSGCWGLIGLIAHAQVANAHPQRSSVASSSGLGSVRANA